MKFLRQEAHFKKRIPLNWRKPKGRHSKLREKRRGLHKMPGIGFGTGRKKEIPLIHNLDELNQLKKGEKAILSKRIGNKKKIQMLELAVKKGIILTNHKKPDKEIKSLKEAYKEKTRSRKPKEKIIKPAQPAKKKVVVKKKEGDKNDAKKTGK